MAFVATRSRGRGVDVGLERLPAGVWADDDAGRGGVERGVGAAARLGPIAPGAG